MNKVRADVHVYTDLLKRYLETADNRFLYETEQMSGSFVKSNILPDQIIRLHMDAVEKLYDEMPNDYKRSLEFLFEALNAYRIAQQDFEEIRQEQLALKSEIEIAAEMQQTLLATKIPQIDGVDIGAISVPFHQMNGDYYHFVQGADGAIGVAIADVIGKGVPAALSMSMIKYSMDSFYEDSMSPGVILHNLNRVVERNVASNMFITMFYAQYFPLTSQLRFASAGHEPGFFYSAATESFTEIGAKGLVLGVLPDTRYNQYVANVEVGDMIILLTDGVTECIHNNRFIRREEVIDVIKMYAHLSAQEQVEQVYDHFNQLEDFQLKDDFTLVIMKKTV